MKIVNLSHVSFPEEKDPELWIEKSRFFKGIWEAVAEQEEVIFIDFIHYNGTVKCNGLEYRFLRRSRKALRFPWRVHRMVARENPDVVIVHGMQFPLQVLSLRFFLKKRSRIVVQDHGGPRLKHPLKKYLQRCAARCADAFFFTAAMQARPYLQEGIIDSGEKIKEVMEVSSVFTPVDNDKARAFTNVSGTYNYLWVGHLNANKDPMLVVKAFSRFAQECDQAALYMIYQSEALLPQINEWLQQHPTAAQHIHLVGKVPHADLEYWFNSASFIISSSHYEAAGVSVTEGMSCGCIPVLSDIPAFNTMTGGHCGILYETGNEEALLEALRQTIHMDIPEERRKTLQQFERQLSHKAIAHRIREILYALLPV